MTTTLNTKELTKCVNNQQSQITDMLTAASPWGLEERFKKLAIKFDELSAKNNMLNHELSLLKNGKFIEKVSSEELAKLRVESGITLPVIAEKLFMDKSWASRLLNGKVNDLILRHKAKQLMLEEIRKKEAENAKV